MNYFCKDLEQVQKELNTNINTGLYEDRVNDLRQKYGFNELKGKKKKNVLVKFLNQFKDFMIIVLIIAAVVSGFVGIKEGEGITDSIIILIVVIVNAIIGMVQEDKAEKSLEALQKMSGHICKVIRDEKLQVVPAKCLIPGDVVILDTGDYIPADLRLIETVNLKIQEAALTGESVPIEKNTKTLSDENISLGDRTNMAFSSSMVTYGRGKGIVTAIGMNTEVGKIASMINEVEENETPLQKRLNDLGKTLGIACLGICVIIFLIGVAYGKNAIDVFMTAVSLAVAAIPEGLAAVSTIVLAIGMQRMAKKNAIVKKLPAVETLGSSSIICSDKTGTLTQNKMTVKELFYNSKTYNIDKIQKNKIFEKLIYANMLCNDTKITEKRRVGWRSNRNSINRYGTEISDIQIL